ncbi:MAG: antibiotic biosynthesis monooxygenase [Bacteroidota bacterium]
MINVIIHFHVNEAYIPVFQQLTQGNLRTRRAARGNLLVLFYQQIDDPTHFILIESFDCQENIDLYYQQNSYLDWYTQVSPLVESIEGADYELRF